MKRYVVPAMGIALLVALAVVVGVSCTQTPLGQVATQGDPGSPADPDGRGPMFPGLEGIPPEQLFDHFLGAQVTMTDRNGVAFTVKMTPGTVTSVVSPTITITPTGQTTTQTFNITSSTIIRGEPGRGSIEALVPGDRVVVMTRDASMDAIMIVKHGARFHRRMMDSMMVE